MTDKTIAETILAHHGVKGMKWGVRGKRGGVTKLKKGAPHTSSEDATKANEAHAKAKKSGTASLSNKELQVLVTRMNLEQQFSKLGTQQKSKGSKFASELIGNVAKQQITRIASDQVTKLVAKSLVK